jgi:hypothetical protein
MPQMNGACEYPKGCRPWCSSSIKSHIGIESGISLVSSGTHDGGRNGILSSFGVWIDREDDRSGGELPCGGLGKTGDRSQRRDSLRLGEDGKKNRELTAYLWPSDEGPLELHFLLLTNAAADAFPQEQSVPQNPRT